MATKQFRFAAAFASRPSTELVGTCQHNKTKQEPAIIVHHFPSFQKKTQNVQMWKLDELDEIATEIIKKHAMPHAITSPRAHSTSILPERNMRLIRSEIT